MKSKIINVLKFVLSSIIFFYSSVLVKYIFTLIDPSFVVDINHIKNVGLCLMIDDIVVCIILIILYRKLLKEDYIKFKNKVKGGSLMPYLKMVARYTVILFMIKFISSYIIAMICMMFNIPVEVSNNQYLVETISNSLPIYMAISSSVIAPLSEELIFRGALGKVLNKKGIFITVSGLIFGLMHITDSMLILGSIFLIGLVLELINKSRINRKKLLSVILIVAYIGIVLITMLIFKFDIILYIKHINLSELVSSISYISIGWYLAYIYKYEDNIWANIGVHSMNNIISYLLLWL